MGDSTDVNHPNNKEFMEAACDAWEKQAAEPKVYKDSKGQQFTNKFNYPLALVRAVLNDTYTRGECEFSATGLLEPPRIARLKEKHGPEGLNDLVLDIDDRIFILYGKMGHTLLETAGRGIGRGQVEQRFFGKIGETTISAQIDSLDLEDDGTLTDYKFTTVYGFKKAQKPKDDWVKQMNIQLELLRQNGLDAKSMRIWGMLRDWRPSEKKREKGYPDKIAFHAIPMADRERTQGMIAKLITGHRDSKKELPLCTDEENWSGRRCDGYCDVASFCEQFKQRREKSEV